MLLTGVRAEDPKAHSSAHLAMAPGAAPSHIGRVLRAFRRPAVALAESLFDRGQGLPPDRVRWMLDDLADFLGHAGHKTELFFLITLFLIEYLPPLFGRFSRMSRLPLPARVAYLEQLDRSRLAALIAMPKAMLGLIWYEHPESLLETGYDHQPLLPAPRKVEE